MADPLRPAFLDNLAEAYGLLAAAHADTGVAPEDYNLLVGLLCYDLPASAKAGGHPLPSDRTPACSPIWPPVYILRPAAPRLSGRLYIY